MKPRQQQREPLSVCLVRAFVMEERLVELESRIAHQELLIDRLNEQLVLQQAQLTRLEAMNHELIARYRSMAAALPSGEAEDQPPPHY